MAGRVLSRANESKLRNALAALSEVLALLEQDEKAAQESMREAANLGNWLESRLHSIFTEIADNLFGDGRLTREERIALSSAIGDALDAFNAVVAERVPQIYKRSPWADLPEDVMQTAAVAEAAFNAEYVPLVEGTLRRDGTVPVKLIQPGWGSSGFYPAEVLERDGPVVFPAGTKMYWNHPTLSEEAERPEGDLRNLAAELTSGARWEAAGVAGPGLYADAKVFAPYQEAVNELAPHIGVSIRAAGRAVAGEADGRTGRIVQQLINARSVDFVTEPGAGGQIISMFEAARRDVSTQRRKGAEAQDGSTDNGALQAQEAIEMEELQAQLAEAQRQIDELTAANARLAVLRDARTLAGEVLAEATLPDVTRRRLLNQVATNPPIGEDGQLDALALRQRVQEAVTAEQQYLSEAAGYGAGRIQGIGGQQAGGQVDEAAVQARMAEAFRSLGLSEASATAAANGRQ